MANSLVKVTDVSQDTIDDSLLLLVGQDGTVTPDRSTVEKYLNSKSGPTNLQVMRIDKSDQKGIDVTVDNVLYLPDNMNVLNEEDIIGKDDNLNVNVVAVNLYNVKLDHDYTPYTTPKHDSPTPDDDELAKTLSILHGNDEPNGKQTKKEVPLASKTPGTKFAKSINVLSNVTIKPQGSVTISSAPLTAEKVISVKNKGKAKILHSSPKSIKKKIAKPEKSIRKKSSDEEESNEETVPEEEDEEFDDEAFHLAVNEDNSDSDFDIEKEITGKKGKKGFEKRSKLNDAKKDAPGKIPKTAKSSQKMSAKGEEVENESNQQKINTKPAEKLPDKPAVTKSEEGSSIEQKEEKELDSKSEDAKTLEKKPPKKKKEPPKPIPGDFALFSTPDIIRKVGGKEPTTPGTPEATSAASKPIGELSKNPQAPKTEIPLSSKPGKITQESRSKSVTDRPNSPSKHNRLSLEEKDKGEKEKQHTHHRSSTETKAKDRRESVDKRKQAKGIDEKKAIRRSLERRSSDSNSDQKVLGSDSDRRSSDSNKSTPKHESKSRHSSESKEISAQDIRAIIMNDDTRTYTTNTIPIPDAPIQLSSASADANNLTLDASSLGLDQSILDNINNDMISEDILYQVAKQLVSNTELQNAIEKGINDGVLDTSSIQEAMDISQLSQSSDSSYSVPNSNIVKEGTQIVRPDGRILILPPIERPTTRSRNKRKEEPEPKKLSFKTVHKPLDEEHVSGNELDSSEEAEEEEESEDDPNKLWCICNQPHNNRFMICCDTCEEWYHGKCVNITKVMGQQMEAEGKEWICLFCKDPALKRPIAAARRIRKASRNSRQSTDSTNSGQKVEKERSTGGVPCVVCQKPARKSSIYCSETCILTHAKNIERVVVFERTTGKMLTGNKAPSAANLNQWLKSHPTYEVLRSSKNLMAAKSKPGQFTQTKLRLVPNSNNEGVSLAIQQRGVNVGVLTHSPKQLSQQAKASRLLKSTKDSDIRDSKVKLIQPQALKPKEQVMPNKKVQVQTLLTPKLTSNTPPMKIPKKDTPKKDAFKDVKQKTPRARLSKDDMPPTPQAKAEDIRDNVQKTVFDHLLIRLKDSDIKLSEEEVKNISVEIESELYKCFGDTGQKYKNKYRSIIFNIKDPKNQTLWRRICEKSISSYQLVRLSPDDMASQELAKWREQEAKHQLDMIKKSEIELLNCNRQYVLKTHKGEEVLEDNRSVNKVDNTEIIKSLTEGSTLEPEGENKQNSSKDRDKSREKRGLSKHGHKDKTKDKDRHSSKDRRDKEVKGRRSSSRERDRSRKRSRSRDHSRSDKKKKEKRSRSRSPDRSREREKNRKSSSYKSARNKKKSSISSTDNLDKRSKEILEQLNKIAPPVEDRLWKHVLQEDVVPGNAPIDSDSDHEIPTSTVTIPTPPRIHDTEDYPSQSSEDSKTSSRLKEVEIEEERGFSPPPKNAATQIWTGTINMVDVAQISISAHEVSGDCTGLNKELTENLDIVGRISPETVWDYIGKMRSSNSKIISLIRLSATNEEEQMPYLALYGYLSSRNRLGVVKSTVKAIKDFYILPLASQKPIPQALLPINGPGFEEARPALLLGIIVRDKRKRTLLDSTSSITPHKRTRVEVHIVQTPPNRSYTPPPIPADVTPAPPPPLPPTPKMDPRLSKLALPPLPPVPEMVPAPPLPGIVSPASNTLGLSIPPSKTKLFETSTANDDDEPYSPEDSDPDTTMAEMSVPAAILTTTAAVSATQTSITAESSASTADDSELSTKKMVLKMQMDEINKQIEMQKSEITTLSKNLHEADIMGSALANIAIPSNLQQILESIKKLPASSEDTRTESDVIEQPPADVQNDLTIPLMIPKTFTRPFSAKPKDIIPTSSLQSGLEDKPTSVLSTLSEEDLIKKAAEMLKDESNKPSSSHPVPPPPPPIGDNYSLLNTSGMEVSLPPVPGVDD